MPWIGCGAGAPPEITGEAEGSTQAKLFGPLVQYERGGNPYGIVNAYLGVRGGDPKEFRTSVFNFFGVSGDGADVRNITIPRSPTVTAMSAWTLAKLSKGRFTLGLGTQVKAHIEVGAGLSIPQDRQTRLEERLASARIDFHRVDHVDDPACGQPQHRRKFTLRATLRDADVPEQHRGARIDADLLDGLVPQLRRQRSDL